MFLKRLVIILFIFCFNSGYTQTWEQLEIEINNYASSKEYFKAFEISNKMEKFALENKNDTNAYLAKVYYYKLVLSIYTEPSDSLLLYYSYKITNVISKFAYSDNFYGVKPDLIIFLSFLRPFNFENSWLNEIYCKNICSLAKIYEKEANIDGAIKLYKEAILVYSKNKNKGEDYCGVLNNYSYLLYDQKSYDEVENNLNEIFFIYDSIGSVSDYFNYALGLYRNMKVMQGKYDQAIKICNKYIPKFEDYKKVGIRYFYMFYSGLAYLNELAGDYKKAQSYYNIINELKELNEIDYLDNLYFYAGFCVKIEDFIKAEKLYTEALKLNEKLYTINSENYASVLNRLGNLYGKMGDNKRGEKLIIEALRIRKSILGDDNPIYAASLGDLAYIYYNISDYSKAQNIYFQSLEIKKKAYGSNSRFVAEIHNELAVLFHKQKKYTSAEFYYTKAIEFYETNKIKDSDLLAIYLSNLGSLYDDIGEYSKAETLQIRAMEIRKLISGEQSIDYANSCSNLSCHYINLNDVINAEKMNLLASKIYLSKLGEYHEYYLNNLDNLTYIYEFFHKDYFLSYKLKEKIFNTRIIILNRNFEWLTEKQKEAYWENENKFYSLINDLVSKSYQSIPFSSVLSFNSNLISKSLLLETSRDLDKALANTNDEGVKNNFEQLKSTRRLYTKLESEGTDKIDLLKKLNLEADSLDKILVNRLVEFRATKDRFNINWQTIQSNLSSDEAAIEFARYYNDSDSAYHYMGLIVKKGDKYPQLIKLCSEDELKQYSPETELNVIYDLVWKPLLPSLDNIKTIYYSPSGLLNNIPFQALYKKENEQREYVMDKFTLHQLTSTRYLALGLKQKEQEPIQTSIALFGGINYNDYPNYKIDTTNHDQSNEAAFLLKNAVVQNRQLDSTRTGAKYLPGTKKEVETIAEVLKLKQWNIDISEGKNATENKIKSFSGNKSKAILHIATHGFAFPDKEEKRKDLAFAMMSGNNKYKALDNPMIRSGLLFGGANLTWQGKGDSLLNITNEDGVLTAYELSQLDLSNTKLAVLSACETGKGAIQGSEGTFGLKRALKLAGVDNMIVSLWKVPDDATMEMMTLFYTELAKTKLPVPAFELAQKTMRNKYPNEPKKWAGFVFVR